MIDCHGGPWVQIFVLFLDVFIMMVMAGSIGIEVKSKLTSLDIIHSFSCSLMPSMLWMKSWVLWDMVGGSAY